MAEPIAHVHRLTKKVACNVGEGPTTYMTAMQARELALALLKAAESVETEKFIDSNIGNIAIQ